MAQGILVAAAIGVALIYANRIFMPVPLYAADEGAYLIRALYGKHLAADPTVAPYVPEISNTVFLLIIRAVTYATQNLLEWMRMLGALAYFGGLLLVWRSVQTRSDKPLDASFLLLALAFPYYRYVVTAMPEGWYVGVIGLLVLATARLYLTRPVTHALLAGALTGCLTLVKPHGLAVVAALMVLAVLDAIVGRRDLRILAGRILLLAVAFLLTGNLVQLAAGQPITNPFTFFIGGYYGRALESQTNAASIVVGMKALALGASGVLLLAGVPIVTGLARIAARWRYSPRSFRLDAAEVTFLLVLLSTAATLAMVAVFAMKALSVYGGFESNRLWGRYFEFFVPMLWLTAAPFIGEFERGGGRTWRLIMALAVQVGLAGLSAFLLTEVMVFPWDTTALNAFFRPDPQKLDVVTAIPYFAIAVIATLAASAAVGMTAWKTSRIWLTYFVTLGVLSTSIDVAWERSITDRLRQLDGETRAADTMVSRRMGGVGLVYDNPNSAHIAFIGLKARAHMVLVQPDVDVSPGVLIDYDTVVVLGPHELTSDAWQPLFVGQQLSVFRRAPPTSPTASPAASLGYGPGTG